MHSRLHTDALILYLQVTSSGINAILDSLWSAATFWRVASENGYRWIRRRPCVKVRARDMLRVGVLIWALPERCFRVRHNHAAPSARSAMSRARGAVRLIRCHPEPRLARELPQPADVLLEHYRGEGLQCHHYLWKLPHGERVWCVGDFWW